MNRCFLFTFGAGSLPFGRKRLLLWHGLWSQLHKALEQGLAPLLLLVHPSPARVSPLPAAIFKYMLKSF